MRRFNREVFNETYDIQTARYTSAEFNELLGSQDVLVVQFRAVKITGTSPTLTIALEGSNNGVDWVSQETLVSAAALTAGSINTATAASSVKLPGYVRLAITMGGTSSPSAQIQIIACGRDSV